MLTNCMHIYMPNMLRLTQKFTSSMYVCIYVHVAIDIAI